MSILHTPAPWDVQDIESAGWQIRGNLLSMVGQQVGRVSDFSFWRLPRIPMDPILDRDTGVLSGLFTYEEYVQFPTPDFKAMQKANAHLISAAPDLLTELKSLVARINRYPGFVIPPSAYAAIVKAEEPLTGPPARTFPRVPNRNKAGFSA